MNSGDLKNKLQGKFIVLDGPDGCGKTVQLELLAKYLKDSGLSVEQTTDPGGTKIGNQISRLLKYDAQGVMDVCTELMLFMASRTQLVGEVIKPALEAGKILLCDRFISATCAYQGSSGYPVEKIIELGKFAVGDMWPDLTIIIDIPVSEGLERTGRKPYQKTKVNHKDADQSYLFENVVVDRFDSRPLEYHRKVRKEFLRLPDYYPGLVKIIDGSEGDIETVHKKIVRLISEVIFT
ncbi:MAG: dTMP kinase [Phycisphaerae bacterium]|nr:dTMP kinase [Phycisphaerae bacterium]NIP55980.1 dTMP kinase [Phycisphaerae bacterium]NIS54545.1 dTMP kinase [Phycisphaerae bacterium]NIU12181.1 dTMP kinase [Phycisphaerae bacterium]NIU58248.1 dTMP kinase [Phycisphaerae bacterium]